MATVENFSADNRKDACALEPSNIKNIMLMCGSNNIDFILRNPKEMRNRVLMQGKPQSFAPSLDKTNRDIDDLVQYLHNWAPSATIKIINILQE